MNTNKLLKCPCKVNIYLRIKGKREDGYHNIESIFLPLSIPWDEMEISCGGEGLKITCNFSFLETENIIYKIYDKFHQYTGIRENIKVNLKKNIPLGAGLGGASSNGAVFLKYLVKLARGKGIPIPRHTVMKIARECGADVPFFMQPHPAHVTGIGEKIHPLHCPFPYKGQSLLVVCPPLHISTKWAYEKWDNIKREKQSHPLTNDFFDINKPFRFWANDFESVVFKEYPMLYRLKRKLLKKGARSCVMSGSGASLIALYPGQIPDTVLEELEVRDITFFINTGV